jgi:hypothetical protein
MLKKLKLKKRENFYFEFESDVKRIVRIFAERGYEISETDAENAWEQYSDSMAAGWMCLDSEDCFVFDNCFHYFEELK